MEKMRFLLTGVMAGLFGVSMALAGEGAAAPAEPKAKAPGGGREAAFATADTNVDGVLSLEEFTVMDAKRLEARKARMGDKFDAEKAAKMPSAEVRFKKLDQDGTGSLTKEEYFAGAAKARPARKDKPAPDAAAGAVQ
jgi:hypothetical protein